MTNEEALKIAHILKDYCAKRNCTGCPFDGSLNGIDVNCRMTHNAPCNWRLLNNKTEVKIEDLSIEKSADYNENLDAFFNALIIIKNECQKRNFDCNKCPCEIRNKCQIVSDYPANWQFDRRNKETFF